MPYTIAPAGACRLADDDLPPAPAPRGILSLSAPHGADALAPAAGSDVQPASPAPDLWYEPILPAPVPAPSRVLTLPNGDVVPLMPRTVYWAPFLMEASGVEMVVCAAITSRGALLPSWRPIPADSPPAVLDALWRAMEELLDRVDPIPAPALRVLS